MAQLRVLVRHQTISKALAGARHFTAKYGPIVAIIEDRDPAGGGDAYPYVTVTPYTWPEYKDGRYLP